jgi:hypothetical protein
MLGSQVAFSSEPVCLVSLVSPYDVAAFVGLEVPWGNQNDVSYPYPHSPLHFSAYPAEALVSVLAAYHDSVEAEHLFGYAEYVIAGWQLDGVVLFAFDLPFAHDTTSVFVFSIMFAWLK